jgi:hypothetical protein
MRLPNLIQDEIKVYDAGTEPLINVCLSVQEGTGQKSLMSVGAELQKGRGTARLSGDKPRVGFTASSAGKGARDRARCGAISGRDSELD